MDTESTPYRVHQCSKCPGDTEYYCESCPCDLCPQCKENHVKDLKTIDHDVVSHRDKINYIPTQETCVRQPSNVYRKYCEPCEFTNSHDMHRLHLPLDIETAYITKRQQHRGTIHAIESEALFYRPVLLTGIKADIKTCLKNFSLYQSEMFKKSKKLIDLIDKRSSNVNYKHSCLKQRKEMEIHISDLERYVNIYEQSAFSPIQFLSTIKKARISQIQFKIHTSQLSMTESLNKEDVMESMSAIQITETGNRRLGNQCLLKLMSAAEFHHSLSVTGVDCCYHISCVTSDRAWVGDMWNNLILTNTTGLTLHHLKDLCSDLYGSHTVNSESELIYIDRNYNINKLSKDMKTTTTFIERIDSTWEPMSVHWSPSCGDLLVAMCRKYTQYAGIGKVARYNRTGKLTQTMKVDNAGRKLYIEPRYITDNNNGDVVVSDYISHSSSGALVVTDCGGRHRFSYTGHPPGSVLEPRGICTDALSHILVCDVRTDTIHMLDINGQFLSHLLIRPSGIFSPRSLSYDVNTHRLWVGSRKSNTVVVYRYIARQDALTDLKSTTLDRKESLIEYPTRDTVKSEEINACRLTLMSSPELLYFLIVTNVHRCYHISGVTDDRVWINNGENLTLTNTTSDIVHRVEDVFICDTITGNGTHTMNGESELIYIDGNYNIKKLSMDVESTTTLVENTHCKWRPRCVYWSSSTEDLLIGMGKENPSTGKVARYDQSGQLTHTMQCDNLGLDLYREPHYITENNNGDVVVSDYRAVVVTERGGGHRFTYTGYPPGSRLLPCGICTDAMSHILVCDVTTKTVQMLDRNGQFLSHLLKTSKEIAVPHSLSYDVNTHRLWVGSRYNNKVLVYRYIDRHDAVTDDETNCPGDNALSSSTPSKEWR